MKIIRSFKELKSKKTVLAIGMFDGVHLGHRKVIANAVQFAKKNNLPSIVLTFSPHPKHIIFPQRQIKLLTTDEEKSFFIEELFVDYLFVLKFNNSIRSMSYNKFVKDILVKKFNPLHIFVGLDYTFGKNKEGNVPRLKALGRNYGFSVTAVRDKIEHDRVVKSSLIRNLIAKNKFSHAVNLLGHHYLIIGKVIEGEGRGKLLGFPTANLEILKNKLIPRDGVYAGYAEVMGKIYCAAVNIGKNPTFGGDKTNVESHIINFHKNIKGKKIKIFLVKKIRNEKEFLNAGELIEAIKNDLCKISKLLSREEYVII